MAFGINMEMYWILCGSFSYTIIQENYSQNTDTSEMKLPHQSSIRNNIQEFSNISIRKSILRYLIQRMLRILVRSN